MILLGLLLMGACAALAVDAVIQNTQSAHAVAFGQSVPHLSIGALFVAGAVAGLLFAIGLAMLTGGIGRAGRKRRERKAAQREAAAENEALRERNQQLRQQLGSNGTRTGAAYPEEPVSDGARDDSVVPMDGDGVTSGRHRR